VSAHGCADKSRCLLGSGTIAEQGGAGGHPLRLELTVKV